LQLYLAVQRMEETVDHAASPRRAHLQLTTRQLLELDPLSRLDAEMLKQVALQRDLPFHRDRKRCHRTLLSLAPHVRYIFITVRVKHLGISA